MAGIRLQWQVDYGTSYGAAAACTIPDNAVAELDNIAILPVQGSRREEFPQLVGYAREENGSWRFTWGHILQDLLSRSAGTQPVVSFKWLKIAVLGEDVDAQLARDRIESGLRELPVEERTVEDLFIRHLVELKAELEDASAMAYGDSNANCPADLTEVPRWTLWAVPEITNLGTRQKLSQLLQKAHWGSFRLVSETEAAGAWRVFRFLRYELALRQHTDLASRWQAGEEMIVADAGGWTLNVASYELLGPFVGGARVPCRPTGRQDSKPYGAEIISKQASKWCFERLGEHTGGTPQCLKELGMSEAEFEQKISFCFETYKRSFQNDGQTFILLVPGREAGAAYTKDRRTRDFRFRFENGLLKDWFDDAFRKIASCIKALITPQTRVLILTGGFFRSVYMVDLFRKAVSPAEIRLVCADRSDAGEQDLPVVRGAATRYNLEPCHVPFRFALGISQDEPWDPDVHADISASSRQLVRPRDSDPCDTDPWVRDRWKTLLPLNYPVNSHHNETHNDTWLEAYVRDPKDDFVWEKKIYWTELEIQDHQRVMRSAGVPYAHLQLHQYGLPLTVTIPRSTVRELPRRYKMIRRRGTESRKQRKDEHPRLYLRIRTTIRGMNVSVDVARMPNKYDPYKNAAQEFIPPPEAQLIHLDSSSMHASAASAVVQRHEVDAVLEDAPPTPLTSDEDSSSALSVRYSQHGSNSVSTSPRSVATLGRSRKRSQRSRQRRSESMAVERAIEMASNFCRP